MPRKRRGSPLCRSLPPPDCLSSAKHLLHIRTSSPCQARPCQETIGSDAIESDAILIAPPCTHHAKTSRSAMMHVSRMAPLRQGVGTRILSHC